MAKTTRKTLEPVEPDAVLEPAAASSSQGARAEARNRPAATARFTVHGEEFTVPANVLDSVEVLELAEDEKFITMCRLILGPTDWPRLKDAIRDDAGVPRTSGLEEFITALMAAVDPTSGS